MKTRMAVLFSMIVLAVGACNVDSVSVPIMDAGELKSPLGLKLAPSMTPEEGCPQGLYCTTPIMNNPIYPDLDTIATNCPEACGGLETGTADNYEEDANGWVDRVRITCPTRGTTLWYSSHGCWDCKWGCAGTRCTTGNCVTVAGSPGFDCRELTCQSGWTGYSGTRADGTKVALCTRPLYAWERPGDPWLPPDSNPPRPQ